jgi:hypothetical protein
MSVTIEFLHTVAIQDIDVPSVVNRHTSLEIEQPVSSALPSPLGEVATAGVEFLHTVVTPVNDIDVHDICRDSNIGVWCGGMMETGIGRAVNVALATLPNFIYPGDISASDRY